MAYNISLAVLDSAVTGPAKAVLLALSIRQGGRSGISYPSIQRLSLDTGLSVATVKRAIRHLRDSGHLIVGKRPAVDGQKWTNSYRIVASPSRDMAQSEPTPGSERALGMAQSEPTPGSERTKNMAQSEPLTRRNQNRTRSRTRREGVDTAKNEGVDPIYSAAIASLAYALEAAE